MYALLLPRRQTLACYLRLLPRRQTQTYYRTWSRTRRTDEPCRDAAVTGATRARVYLGECTWVPPPSRSLGCHNGQSELTFRPFYTLSGHFACSGCKTLMTHGDYAVVALRLRDVLRTGPLVNVPSTSILSSVTAVCALSVHFLPSSCRICVDGSHLLTMGQRPVNGNNGVLSTQ